MSSSKFRDLSAGTKLLIVIEQAFFVSSVLLAVYLNTLYQIVNYQVLSSKYLLFYAFIFAVSNQLSVLALGLYNSKLRESFRGILRRMLMCVSVAFCAVTIINPIHGKFTLPIEILAIASCLGVFFYQFFSLFYV